jgi:hypothetical protein
MTFDHQPVQRRDPILSVLLTPQMERGDKVEELAVGTRPLHRGFRYGGNIRLPKTPKFTNCETLEVYVDGQRFTLYPGSDMEVRAGTTVRMEVESKVRSVPSIEPVFCTFYGKP